MKTRYRVVMDNDGHHYLIPADKDEEWDEFLDLEGEAAWDVPEWARDIDFPALTFTDPRLDTDL